ncbi:mannose-1-phosphate guanylyltransferase [Chamaesiphon sp. GL140_3_metabinner_50]|uniref:mannose-1-phosphate guanylyltransferase n=1 Tax=Chamaesiphon sp. GL140_3_metabinner_50 TaxID=2970812 RepID=UPI0025E23BD2|nr:mannose-1-phosphate guanylyltransferase [Chamaesiphon sp. GL140_3_metabinner_50]
MQPKFVPLILAGGKGERFWPLSRKQRPKQFLCLDGSGESLIQATANRLLPIVGGWEDIWVITSQLLETGVQEQLPSLPAANLLAEPEGRDTAAAVAWASLEIAKRYGDDVIIGFFPADAWIADAAAFGKTIAAAVELAHTQGAIVTLGITPTFPSIGYGYIQQGASSGEYQQLQTYRAIRFTEKPDIATAQDFIASGNYTWNSGIFIFKAKIAIAELQIHAPELMQLLIEKGVSIYPTLPKISIDYALMEKTKLTHVIPADFGWDDLGDWNAIERLMKGDNINVELANHVCIDTKGSVLYASNPDEVIVTIGLENVVVVRDGDVTLIVAKDRTQEIKQIVNKIKENKQLDRLL